MYILNLQCVQLSVFHHHHSAEETYTFPRFEANLGKGTLEVNIEQHNQFVPQMEDLDKYLRDVQEGKQEYDGQRIVDTINSFGDVMHAHLEAVRYLWLILQLEGNLSPRFSLGNCNF